MDELWWDQVRRIEMLCSYCRCTMEGGFQRAQDGWIDGVVSWLRVERLGWAGD